MAITRTYSYRPIRLAQAASLRVVGLVTALGLATALGYALGLAAALGLIMMLTAGTASPGEPPIAAPPPAAWDPSRFMLNALLVPALDGDAVPLRWVDPRPASLCGPDTAVRVNGEPLRAGALVPDAPFELEWQADGCRPFGAHGPRFVGRVKLTVFREDWGFSAMVEPSGLRVTSPENATTLIQRGAASLPQSGNADESVGKNGHEPRA
jgi:hypothetical protein